MDLKLQAQCRDEIKEQMAKSYNSGKLNTDFLKDVVEKFGQDMVEVTIAKSIPQSDGRISIPNQDWAKDIINNSNDDLTFAVGINEHAGILNVLINRYADFKEQLAIENENIENIYNNLSKEFSYDDAETINDYIKNISFEIKDDRENVEYFMVEIINDKKISIDDLQGIEVKDFMYAFKMDNPELLIHNQEEKVGAFYKVTETYQIGDSEIGYGASDTGKTYGTWECIPSITEEKGSQDWFNGHYFDNENDAKEDFKNRIADKENLMCIKEENKYANKENTKEIEKGFSLDGMKALKKTLETKETKVPTNGNREER